MLRLLTVAHIHFKQVLPDLEAAHRNYGQSYVPSRIGNLDPETFKCSHDLNLDCIFGSVLPWKPI